MKKLLLGLVLSGVAITSLAATKVNAEENFSYKQDFNYTSDELTVPGGDYNITSNNHTGATFQSMNDEGEYLRYTLPSNSTDDTARKIEIGGNSSGSDIVTAANGKDKTLVLKTRFKSDQGHRKSIGIYYGKTAQLLNYTDGAMQYNLGDGKNVTLPADFGGVSKNTWHELVVVIADNGTATEDRIYTYLDDELLYESSFPENCDFTGRIKNVFYQSEKGANRPTQNWDIDYLYVGEYNGATASVNSSYTTNVGESLSIVPTLEAVNSSFDVSIPNYNIEIEDETKLTYNEQTAKFEPIAEGETTVTFDFVDPLIGDVSTTVNVEAAEGEILVTDILLNDLFKNNTINLSVGEYFDLTKLFTVAPAAATNKNLVYESDSSQTYSIVENTITALKAGSGVLKVKSQDGNKTQDINVVVSDGVYIGTPAVGSVFDAANKTFANSENEKDRFTAESYNGKEFDKVTVVDDELFGATYVYEGTGATNNAGASHIAHWIYADELKANENYILTAFAKLEGTIPNGCVPRVDLKIWGIYEETQNADGTYKYTYEKSNGPLYAQYQAAHKELTNGWVQIETPVMNFDSERLVGLKIELIAYNNMNGITSYVSHAALKAVGGDVVLKDVEATCGEETLSNVEANAPEITLTTVGANAQVNVLPVPSTAALTATYESTKPEVATVDATGKVTAVANGETVIKVTANNSTYYLKVTVAIEKHIESIEIEDENVTLTTDDKTFNVSLTLNPVDYTSTINVVAADPTIVTVSNASIVGGKLYITPLKAGTTTITLTSEDNPEVKLTITVTVTETATEPEEPEDENKPCTGITLDKTSVTLNVGDTHTIKATLTPNDTTDKVTYTSSDANVVSVDATGKVTAKAKGTATITVKCGDKEATLTVTVNEAPVTTPDDNSNAGLIWGIVGGVLAAVVIAGVVTFVVLKKKRLNK